MARHCALWLLLALLTACARQPVLPADVLQQHWHWPLPQQLWLQVQQPQQPALDYLLVLQDEQGVLRASLFDPAGIPVYVIDPNGFVVLRYAPGFDTAGLRADLAKLLKLNAPTF